MNIEKGKEYYLRVGNIAIAHGHSSSIATLIEKVRVVEIDNPLSVKNGIVTFARLDGSLGYLPLNTQQLVDINTF